MNTRKKILSNFLWRFFERCGAQGVSMIVSIVLARLLDPEVYGTLALVTVISSILQVFIDSGLSGGLVQKKNADDLDFSSVFYFNIVVCIILYCIVFFLSPSIARFYERPDLVPVIRVLSLTLIVAGLKNVQHAYVARNMIFKRFFFATLAGTIGAAVIGILMAYRGFGVWALVAQHLFNTVVDTVILWITVKWRPKLLFSWNRLKSLLGYGWKLLAASLLDRIYSNIRTLIIGKKYSESDLAFYNKGGLFPGTAIDNMNIAISSILLPSMSAEQDSTIRVRDMMRRAIKVNTFIVFPMMAGLAACATPLTKIVLTGKWLPSVFYMRLFCFSYAFYPLHFINLNAVKALGRSDMYLKAEVAKKIVGLICIITTMWISVKAMAFSLVITAITGLYINSYPNKKLLGYGFLNQIRDIFPQAILSCIMGIVVWGVSLVNLPEHLILISQILIGIVIYIIGSILSKNDSYYYVLETVKSYLKKY